MTYVGVPTGSNQAIFWDGQKRTFSAYASSSLALNAIVNSTSSWTTIYEVDFTTIPAQNVSANGLISLNGVNWDRINNTNASWMAMSGTNVGFEIKVNANNSDYWISTRTAPALVLPLKNIPILSNSYFDYNMYELRLLYQISASNNNSNFETIQAVIEKSSSLPTMNWISIERNDSQGTNTLKVYQGTNNGGIVYGSSSLGNLGTGGCTIISDGYGATTRIFNTPNGPGGGYDVESTSTISSSAKFEWTSYTFSNGIAPHIADYRDINFLFLAKTGAVSKDISGNMYRFAVQIRPKKGRNLVKFNPLFKSASYTMSTLDNFVFISASSAITMSLPNNPYNGLTYVFKDAVGNANTNNTCISSSTYPIDNNSTTTINTNYGFKRITFTLINPIANLGMWGVS